jgi:hypothetical protein
MLYSDVAAIAPTEETASIAASSRDFSFMIQLQG